MLGTGMSNGCRSALGKAGCRRKTLGAAGVLVPGSEFPDFPDFLDFPDFPDFGQRIPVPARGCRTDADLL